MVHFANIKKRIVESATIAAIRAMEERADLPTAMVVAEAVAAATAAAVREARGASNSTGLGRVLFGTCRRL